MLGPFETLGVDLVDFLGAGRASCEPAVVGNHFQAADRGGQGALTREDGISDEVQPPEHRLGQEVLIVVKPCSTRD